MGAADIVPGVSGGTMALITGIYSELIESIDNLRLEQLKLLKNKGWNLFGKKSMALSFTTNFWGNQWNLIFIRGNYLSPGTPTHFALVIFLWTHLSQYFYPLQSA